MPQEVVAPKEDMEVEREEVEERADIRQIEGGMDVDEGETTVQLGTSPPQATMLHQEEDVVAGRKEDQRAVSPIRLEEQMSFNGCAFYLPYNGRGSLNIFNPHHFLIAFLPC